MSSTCEEPTYVNAPSRARYYQPYARFQKPSDYSVGQPMRQVGASDRSYTTSGFNPLANNNMNSEQGYKFKNGELVPEAGNAGYGSGTLKTYMKFAVGDRKCVRVGIIHGRKVVRLSDDVDIDKKKVASEESGVQASEKSFLADTVLLTPFEWHALCVHFGALFNAAENYASVEFPLGELEPLPPGGPENRPDTRPRASVNSAGQLVITAYDALQPWPKNKGQCVFNRGSEIENLGNQLNLISDFVVRLPEGMPEACPEMDVMYTVIAEVMRNLMGAYLGRSVSVGEIDYHQFSGEVVFDAYFDAFNVMMGMGYSTNIIKKAKYLLAQRRVRPTIDPFNLFCSCTSQQSVLLRYVREGVIRANKSAFASVTDGV